MGETCCLGGTGHKKAAQGLVLTLTAVTIQQGCGLHNVQEAAGQGAVCADLKPSWSHPACSLRNFPEGSTGVHALKPFLPWCPAFLSAVLPLRGSQRSLLILTLQKSCSFQLIIPLSPRSLIFPCGNPRGACAEWNHRQKQAPTDRLSHTIHWVRGEQPCVQFLCWSLCEEPHCGIWSTE